MDWIPPRVEAVMFGINPGWSPAMERCRQRGEPCEVCGAARDGNDRLSGGSIADGSRLYCAACGRSGHEFRLEQERLKPLNAYDETKYED